MRSIAAVVLVLLSFTSIGKDAPSLNAQQNAHLRAILDLAGVTAPEYSSETRTPKRQIEILLANCAGRSTFPFVSQDPTKCKAEDFAPKYSDTCMGAARIAFDPNVSDDQNVNKLTSILTSTLNDLGESRSCLQHIVLPGVSTRNNAIDILPKSVPDGAALYDAVHHVQSCADKSRFFYPRIARKPESPVPDNAYHLEFRSDGSCAK